MKGPSVDCIAIYLQVLRLKLYGIAFYETSLATLLWTMPGGELFVMDHGRDCFLHSNSSLLSGRMTGRKTKSTLNNPKVIKYQWVSKSTWGHILVWMLREQDRRLKSNHKIFMSRFTRKYKKTYCISKISLKYSFSTGPSTILGWKTQPAFMYPFLSLFCFIFQKHLGWMNLATRSGMFRSSKLKIKTSISVICYNTIAWIVKCHLGNSIKWAPTYYYLILSIGKLRSCLGIHDYIFPQVFPHTLGILKLSSLELCIWGPQFMWKTWVYMSMWG